MKKVPVKDLKEGLIFSAPVYIEGNNLLVPAGVAIRQKDLARLYSWNIESVETDGEPIAPPENGNVKTENEANEANIEEKTEATPRKPSIMSLPQVVENKSEYRSYLDLIERLDSICTNISANVAVEASSIDTIAGRLLNAVMEQRRSFVGFILGGEVRDQTLAKSLVNTAILSALIAMELKLPNQKVMQVVTGALLHDVGMLRIPSEIVGKKGGLSEPERQRIQSHSLYTHKIVTKELLYPEEVGLIVMQHHERWDGEGYPRRIAGKNIDLGARIVSVSDAFEAMVSKKPYRNSMMGYQAMKNLLSDNLRRFDPDVVKAFIQTMGIYPIGSIVLLNNGAMARVEEIVAIAPLRPRIRILIDEFGKVFKQDEGELFELLTEKSLFIARAVDPKEIAGKEA